ncbi:unnamed protein product [Penicillium salamii]|nr:unnamed protein product [Penicillium salamii]
MHVQSVSSHQGSIPTRQGVQISIVLTAFACRSLRLILLYDRRPTSAISTISHSINRFPKMRICPSTAYHATLLFCSTVFLLSSPGYAYEPLSDKSLRELPRPDHDFDPQTGALLAKILQPRVPNSAGSAAVRNHFIDFFRDNLPEWNIELQRFHAKTPISRGKGIEFVNFIASRDPPGTEKENVGRITLVAHYDSLSTPEGFIGAIDSAGPCAIILHVVRTLNTALSRKWGLSSQSTQPLGIQVLFLDGEEAFVEANATDSMYGSRSLAAEWAQDTYPPGSKFDNRISSISIFILLDLLGAKSPRIQSYFPETHWAYLEMSSLERRLRCLKQFKSEESAGSDFWFIDGLDREHPSNKRLIYDDHIPFLKHNVSTLHVIDVDPVTGDFPQVWHTLLDDGNHLDLDVMGDWALLITAFVGSLAGLEGYMNFTEDIQPNIHGF